MKILLSIFALVFLFSDTLSQTLNRRENESAETFIKRVYNIEELAHPIIETNEWDSSKKIIIFFYDFFDPERYGIIGSILTPIKQNIYLRTLIDTFYTSGGTSHTEVQSVFFANVDKDKERELVVMTKAKAHSPRFADYDASGYYYETAIFDNPKIDSPVSRLRYFKKLSAYFDCFEGSIYDSKTGKLLKREKAKFKDINAVRAALKQLVY